MDALAIVLRIVHILCAIVWVGGAALLFFYIEPTINALGGDGEKVMNELIGRRKMPIYFVAVSTLAVLAGAVLYWRDSSGLQLSWISTPAGLGFTVGAVAALAAWLGGTLLIPTTIARRRGSGYQRGGRPTERGIHGTPARSPESTAAHRPGRHRAPDRCRPRHGERPIPRLTIC